MLSDPVQVPKQPHEAELIPLRELESKPIVCNIVVASPTNWIEAKYSSYRTLLHVTAWSLRMSHNLLATIRGHDKVLTQTLSPFDLIQAETFLFSRSQSRTFPDELTHLRASPPLPLRASSKLLSLHPFLGQDGLLHVGGRLSQADLAHSQKHPIIVSSKDSIIELLLKYNHVCLGHCGPTFLMSHAGERFHIIGARRLARSICSHCITCKKVSARVETQRMGQLPAARTTPSPPFSVTGIDYAGPFTLKRGHTRKPVLVKAYIALFVCFSTKAVHIEIVSDLTTEAFLTALKRFVSRRGLPSAIHSDNGANFVGARNDLNELYRFLSSTTTSSAIHSYLLTNRISWHCIPERAPHFGGLWEAVVQSTKYHLRRVIGAQRLDFEEFSTITAQVEACLNSRPLCSTTSHSPDGIMLLTPGHFLIGRSLRAYQETTITSEPSLHKRWTLCQAVIHHFWRRWSGEYLQQLQKAGKWHTVKPNLQVGDLVLITDDAAFTNHWITGKVIRTFKGRDQLVRAVDVLTETVCKLPSSSNDHLAFSKQLQTRTAVLRRPIAKLALLLPAETSTSSTQPSPEEKRIHEITGPFIGVENVQSQRLLKQAKITLINLYAHSQHTLIALLHRTAALAVRLITFNYVQLTCVYQQQFYRLIIHYACNSPLPYMVIPVTTPTNPCSPPKIFPLFSIHYLKLQITYSPCFSSCYLCACVTCSSCAYPSSSSLTWFGQF